MTEQALELVERFGSYGSFFDATEGVCTLLGELTGLKTWLVTRIIDGKMVVLATFGPQTMVHTGTVVPYDQTMCYRMIENRAPMIAADANATPGYECVQVKEALGLGSYAATALLDGDGELFGTLIGIDHDAKDAKIAEYEPFFKCAANLLSTILNHETLVCRMGRQMQRAELANHMVEPDIYDWEGWDRFCSFEEMRCRTYGAGCGIILVEPNPDHPGHQFIRQVLLNTVRPSDFIARFDDGAYAVLLPETPKRGTLVTSQRIRQALQLAGVRAKVGWQTRDHKSNLFKALEDLKEPGQKSA